MLQRSQTLRGLVIYASPSFPPSCHTSIPSSCHPLPSRPDLMRGLHPHQRGATVVIEGERRKARRRAGNTTQVLPPVLPRIFINPARPSCGTAPDTSIPDASIGLVTVLLRGRRAARERKDVDADVAQRCGTGACQTCLHVCVRRVPASARPHAPARCTQRGQHYLAPVPPILEIRYTVLRIVHSHDPHNTLQYAPIARTGAGHRGGRVREGAARPALDAWDTQMT